MLKRFLEIKDQLIKGSNDVHGEIPIDIGTSFAAKTTKYEQMLSGIDVVTKNLQSSCNTLRQCRESLDTLLDAVEEEREVPRSAFLVAS